MQFFWSWSHRISVCRNWSGKQEKYYHRYCLPTSKSKHRAIFGQIEWNSLGLISKQNKSCHLMGDFNLDLYFITALILPGTQEFIDSLLSYGFYQFISKPTRITSHSATLKDNIFTNEPSKCTHSCIVLNDLSDHMLVVANCFDDLPPK